jgi:hypothetical protein
MPQIPLSRISGMMCAWRGCAATFEGQTPPGWMNLLTLLGPRGRNPASIFAATGCVGTASCARRTTGCSKRC